MSELTLKDFFDESKEYGDEEYGQIPVPYREDINEILAELAADSEEEEEEPAPT